jgi:hypothetical protein
MLSDHQYFILSCPFLPYFICAVRRATCRIDYSRRQICTGSSQSRWGNLEMPVVSLYWPRCTSVLADLCYLAQVDSRRDARLFPPPPSHPSLPGHTAESSNHPPPNPCLSTTINLITVSSGALKSQIPRFCSLIGKINILLQTGSRI